jgi:hypothetical protein
MAKKTTLETLAEQLAKIDARMTKGFASLSTRIDKLNNRVENVDARMQRGFAALADDVGDIKRDMASKGRHCTRRSQRSKATSEAPSRLGSAIRPLRCALPSSSGWRPQTRPRHHACELGKDSIACRVDAGGPKPTPWASQRSHRERRAVSFWGESFLGVGRSSPRRASFQHPSAAQYSTCTQVSYELREIPLQFSWGRC